MPKFTRDQTRKMLYEYSDNNLTAYEKAFVLIYNVTEQICFI
jgi:hypothetical protein